MNKKNIFSTKPSTMGTTNSTMKQKLNAGKGVSFVNKNANIGPKASIQHQNNFKNLNKNIPKNSNDISGKDIKLFQYLADVKNGLVVDETESQNKHISDQTNEGDANSKTYEKLLSKMFKYLKEKVTPQIYDELKIILSEELKTDHVQESEKNNVHDVMNFLTKNSRNFKGEILNLEKREKNEDLHQADLGKKNVNLNAHLNQIQGITHNNSNNSSNNAKNLKLSFDFTSTSASKTIEKGKNSYPISEENGEKNLNKINSGNINSGSCNNKIPINTPKGCTGTSTKESSMSQAQVVNNNQLNFVNNNTSNSKNLPNNMNLKGFQHFSNLNNNKITFGNNVNHTFDNIQTNSQSINKSNLNNLNNSKKNNINPAKAKNSMFNILKIGGVDSNVISVSGNGNGILTKMNELKSLASKTQCNSLSKSNSKEANINRSLINSLSHSKSKTKFGTGTPAGHIILKRGTVNLKLEPQNINLNKSTQNQTDNKKNNCLLNPIPHNVQLKLNANLTKKMAISPENVRTTFASQTNNNYIKISQNQNICSENNNKFKQNKNINLSTQTPFDNPNAIPNSNPNTNASSSNIKKITHTQNAINSNAGKTFKRIIKPSEAPTLNAKHNNTFNVNNVTSAGNFNDPNAIKKTIANINAGNFNFNSNDKRNQNTGLGMETLTSYNTLNSINLNNESSKRVSSAASKKIMDLTYNVNVSKESNRDKGHNTITKVIELNENCEINSKKGDLNFMELKGENKNNTNCEIMKEIKLNLDDNLKSMFNFSYENFHKDYSESGHSTKKSEDLSDNEIIVQNETKTDNDSDKKM